VSESEKKIAELESTIAHIELRLSKPETMEEKETKEIYSNTEKSKKQLSEEMGKWENLSAAFEQLRNQ
jgi:hypothetical protein